MKNPPEYKRFRTAVVAVYIVFTVIASICAATAAGRGAYARMGTPPPSTPKAEVDARAIAACMRDLDGLSTELNRRLDATLASWPAKRSGVAVTGTCCGTRTVSLTVTFSGVGVVTGAQAARMADKSSARRTMMAILL